MGRRASAPSLAELRREIARLDHTLVRLVATRLRVARRAIEVRRARGEGPTDTAQERRVRNRARRWAAEADVNAELVDALLCTLLEAGKHPGPSSYRARAPHPPIGAGSRGRPGTGSDTLALRPDSSLETVLRTIERAELAGHKVGEGPSH